MHPNKGIGQVVGQLRAQNESDLVQKDDTGSQNFVEISNISPLLSMNNLRELFECCGTIKLMDTRERIGPMGKERFFIVQFSTADEQEAAVLLTGTQLGEKTLVVKRMSFEQVREMVVQTTKQDPETAQVAMDEVERARQQVEMWARAAPGSSVEAKGKDPSMMTEADLRREEQISRTIYVGNLDPQLVEDHVKEFFGTQGELLYVKMSAPGLEQRYCFVEFKEEIAAKRAFALSGTVLGDRAIKIGKVTTPISKTVVPSNILANPVRLSNAMSHVRCALEHLHQRKNYDPVTKSRSLSSSEGKNEKTEDRDDRDDSRRRRKRRRRRSRSRSYSSYSRSRSRSRRRKRRRRRSRSRSFGKSFGRQDRLRNSRFGRRAANSGMDRQKDMVWDGFQWHPKNSEEGKATKSAADLGLRGPAGYPNMRSTASVATAITTTQLSASSWPGTGAGGIAGQLGAQLAHQSLIGGPPGI